MIIHCDGAARGNPGPAGIGALIQDTGGHVLAEIAEGISVATNNVAEYRAVIVGLRRALELGAVDVQVRSDSKLLVEQLSGRWRVRNPVLIELHREVLDLVEKFRKVEFEHVPRARNAHADRLANEGVDRWLAGLG